MGEVHTALLVTDSPMCASGTAQSSRLGSRGSGGGSPDRASAGLRRRGASASVDRAAVASRPSPDPGPRRSGERGVRGRRRGGRRGGGCFPGNDTKIPVWSPVRSPVVLTQWQTHHTAREVTVSRPGTPLPEPDTPGCPRQESASRSRQHARPRHARVWVPLWPAGTSWRRPLCPSWPL